MQGEQEPDLAPACCESLLTTRPFSLRKKVRSTSIKSMHAVHGEEQAWKDPVASCAPPRCGLREPCEHRHCLAKLVRETGRWRLLSTSVILMPETETT